jgi:hypothetical protein
MTRLGARIPRSSGYRENRHVFVKAESPNVWTGPYNAEPVQAPVQVGERHDYRAARAYRAKWTHLTRFVRRRPFST